MVFFPQTSTPEGPSWLNENDENSDVADEEKGKDTSSLRLEEEEVESQQQQQETQVSSTSTSTTTKTSNKERLSLLGKKKKKPKTVEEDDDIQQQLQQLPQIDETNDDPPDSSSGRGTSRTKKSKSKMSTLLPFKSKSGPRTHTATSAATPRRLKTDGSAAQAAKEKTWTMYIRDTFRRDGRLLLITIAILIVMNVPYLKYVLYPFTIFSTWIHELCHGLSSLFVGGQIEKLKIFPDTSGLAYTSGVSQNRRGFVISAGYQGTAVIGCLLLLVRRTKRGPRSGTMGVATLMIVSTALWIRNLFGIIFVGSMGVVLAGLALLLPSTHIRNVYIILSVTTCLNAFTSIQVLFGNNHVVNGEPSSTDAHSMANAAGGTHIVWATLWFLLSIVLTLVGILFAIPGPDEVADFALCGLCQDWGLFTICNCRGRRLRQKAMGKVLSWQNNSNTTANH